MTKDELKKKILTVLKAFNGREEAIFDTCWKEIAELEKENEKLKNRNAELKGMYAHSAREAGTYKQFFEKEKKENAELKEQIKDIKNCLEEWFKYENERDYELNVDELLIETQQLLDKEIEND